MVVAPSLTPEGYNRLSCDSAMIGVVAPSLTPEGYNVLPAITRCTDVVAPSLTPEGYNRSDRNPRSAWRCAGFCFFKTH